MRRHQVNLVILTLIVPLIVVDLCGQPLDKVPANALKPGDQAPPLEFEFVVQGPPPRITARAPCSSLR